MIFVVLVHVHVGSNMGRVGRRGGKGRGGKGESREVVVGGEWHADSSRGNSEWVWGGTFITFSCLIQVKVG